MTLVRAAQAEVLDSDPASVITLLLDPEHTGGVLTSNRTLLRNGTDGAPPHRHTRSGELFFVLDGALEMLVGEELHTLRKGDALFVAPDQPHAFAPADGHDADFLVVITPGKPRFDYYRLLDRVHRGEATWAEVGETQDRFDNHYVDSPVWAGRRARACPADHDGLRRAQLPPRCAVRTAEYNTGIRPPGPLATRNLDLGSASP